MTTEVINFNDVKRTTEYIKTARQENLALTDALYKILDSKKLVDAKELAADALGEDLQEYFEKDSGVDELDFDTDIIDYDDEASTKQRWE